MGCVFPPNICFKSGAQYPWYCSMNGTAMCSETSGLFWRKDANPRSRAFWGECLRPLACCDYEFESRREHRCFVLYKYRSLQRADPSSRGDLPCVYESLSVISCNINALHLKLIGIRVQNEPKQIKKLLACITADVITRCIKFRVAGKSPMLLLVVDIL